ncbi:MAG: terminase family protein, partial [Paracoccaceae bacterium]
MKSGAAWLVSATQEEIDGFMGALGENALLALPWVFEFWALPHQLPPEGAWKTWVIMGGRGAGKTRAGAEWVRAQVEGARPRDPGRARRVALVAETLDQAREVMVLGDSGILACSPPDRRPKWISSRNMLEWPNGAVAQVFSAHDPESLRGPQFDAAWVDELAKWPKAQSAWDQLQFGLRLGQNPQAVVTTTPRNVDVLKGILKNPSSVITRAPTEANRAYLAASFLTEVEARFAGTMMGRQELLGEIVEDVPDALWTPQMVARAQEMPPPETLRVVVAVDPPVTATKVSDECGIVVVGADTRGEPKDWRAVVLADRSVRGASP